MPTKALNYPHPVLDAGGRDFPGCNFQLHLISQDDTGGDLAFLLSITIDCPGLQEMVETGQASAYLRIRCSRTSYREARKVSLSDPFELRIPKERVAGSISLQAVIVASQSIEQYELAEFNASYFSSMVFKIRKGDILAIEPGLLVKLDSVLEKDMAGVVQVTCDSKASEMRVHYAAIEDMDPNWTDYIYVVLPEAEYISYGKLRLKKHLKHGVERFLQCSIVLPAITEALSLLRKEEMIAEEDLEAHHMGTIWAESLYASLAKIGIESLAEQTASDCEIANRLLGDVMGDSISNLLQKLTEWSTIRDEDDAL